MWTRVKINSVGESVNGKVKSSEVDCTFYIRPNEHLSEDCYVIYDQHKYNITGIEDVTQTICQFRGKRVK